MAVALLSSTTRMSSQSVKVIDSLAKATTWIDNTSVKELKEISKCYLVKVKYDNSIAQRDSLKCELQRFDSIKSTLSNRQRELHNALSTIFNGRTISQGGQMYSRCDTTILLRHQGLYGDSTVESMQEALFACRRAEGVLSVRFDNKNVDRARKAIESAKTILPREHAELDRRLEQYGMLTDSLRHALIIADTLDKLNSTEELSSSSTERYTRRFFDKLAENVNPLLLSTSEYPYLYGILTKAMAIIMDDPRKSIAELIDEL